jgi:hypothetical protein
MKLYWHRSGSGRIETQIPEDAISDCSAQGSCDDAVDYWAPRIARPEKAPPELLASELREFGAWDAEQLADDDANWRRWIWTACCDLAEADELEEVAR